MFRDAEERREEIGRIDCLGNGDLNQLTLFCTLEFCGVENHFPRVPCINVVEGVE